MLVIVNGMQRSGSTLCYNALRLLVDIIGLGFGIGTRTAEDIPKLIADLHDDTKLWRVVKTHLFVPDHAAFHSGYAAAIYTYRNPLDIAASHKRIPEHANWTNKSLLSILHWQMNDYFSIKRCHGTLMFRYEDMIKDIAGTVRLMSEWLNMDATKSDITVAFEAVSMENTLRIVGKVPLGNYNGLWELRHKHISETKGEPGAWKHVLSKGLIGKIRRELRPWMEDAGYY